LRTQAREGFHKTTQKRHRISRLRATLRKHSELHSRKPAIRGTGGGALVKLISVQGGGFRKGFGKMEIHLGERHP